MKRQENTSLTRRGKKPILFAQKFPMALQLLERLLMFDPKDRTSEEEYCQQRNSLWCRFIYQGNCWVWWMREDFISSIGAFEKLDDPYYVVCQKWITIYSANVEAWVWIWEKEIDKKKKKMLETWGVFVAVIILGALSERLVATKSLYKKYVLLVKVVLHFYVQPPKKLKFLIQFLILWCGQLRFSLLDLDVGFVLYSSSISQFMVVTDRKESNDFNLTITHLIFLMATLIII